MQDYGYYRALSDEAKQCPEAAVAAGVSAR